MYKSKFNSYTFMEIIVTSIYIFLLFLSQNIFVARFLIEIIYELFIISMIVVTKIYIDYHNNTYIEEQYPELFQKYKSKFYDYRKNLLSFEIFLDIKNNKIDADKCDNLYNVAKEGVYFIIFEVINFIIIFINFAFIITSILFIK